MEQIYTSCFGWLVKASVYVYATDATIQTRCFPTLRDPVVFLCGHICILYDAVVRTATLWWLYIVPIRLPQYPPSAHQLSKCTLENPLVSTILYRSPQAISSFSSSHSCGGLFRFHSQPIPIRLHTHTYDVSFSLQRSTNPSAHRPQRGWRFQFAYQTMCCSAVQPY